MRAGQSAGPSAVDSVQLNQRSRSSPLALA
jgi:hypothetical protein